MDAGEISPCGGLCKSSTILLGRVNQVRSPADVNEKRTFEQKVPTETSRNADKLVEGPWSIKKERAEKRSDKGDPEDLGRASWYEDVLLLLRRCQRLVDWDQVDIRL